MLGFEATWLDYMEVDDKTDRFYLNKNAPKDVKKAYKKHMKKERWYIRHNIPMPR